MTRPHQRFCPAGSASIRLDLRKPAQKQNALFHYVAEKKPHLGLHTNPLWIDWPS
jgi:hypothetical protein